MAKRKGFKTSPSIRIPRKVIKRVRAAEKTAMDSVEIVKQQAFIHQQEISVLSIERVTERVALRDLIRMLDARRRKEWTPADDVRLEAIRALAVLS